MKEIIFHIGSHKTGTTTLQRTLGTYAEAFQKVGIYYPRSARIGQEGHHNLVYEVASKWKYNLQSGGWKELEAELKDRPEDIILISSESFSGYINQPIIGQSCARLAESLGRNARSVLMLRPQFSFLESLYAQNAATGYTSFKFERYLLERIAAKAGIYSHIIENWRKNFQECEVYPFMPEQGSSFISQFFKALFEIKLPDTIQECRANDRRGARAVEFGRKTCEIMKSWSKSIRETTEMTTHLSAICAQKFPKEPRFSAFDPKLAQNVQNIFENENNILFERYPNLRDAFHVPGDKIMRKTAVDLDNAGPNLRDEFLAIFYEVMSQRN